MSSRLLGVGIVLSTAALSMFIACGGGKKKPTGDDTGDDQGDDQPGIDASSGNDSTFGEICTGTGSGDQTVCDPDDNACVSLTGTAFFCTAGCGVGSCAPGGTPGSDDCFEFGSGSAAVQATPPAGGDDICAGLTLNNGTASAFCALASTIPTTNDPPPTADQAIVWACALVCGDDGSGGDFGDCPTGLQCIQNFCQ